MSFGSAARLALSLITPPRCAVCGAPCELRLVLCAGCERSIGSARAQAVPVAGLGTVIAAAPYEGAARGLVSALKFGHRRPLAARVADAIAALLADDVPGDVVPVPAAPARRRGRGFDPAEVIAAALARRLEADFRPCLTRRDGPRQVGRSRSARLADPPRVRLDGSPPARALLVDDVVTTGATLAASAAALAAGGCVEIVGVAFAHSTGTGRDSLGEWTVGA